MADPHLPKFGSVPGTFDTVIVLPAAESIPHDLLFCVNGCCGPIGIPMIGDHAAKVLERFIFVLHRRFQPVFTVEVHDDPALVKTPPAFGKIRLYNKGKELFLRLHLQHRGVVIPKMIVGPLPKIRVGHCHNLDLIVFDLIRFRSPCPPQQLNIKFHILPPHTFL